MPREPKTTYNVGQIEGGVSVNTIAPRASLVLNLHSNDPVALEALVGQIDAIVRGAQRGDIRVSSEVIGENAGREARPTRR